MRCLKCLHHRGPRLRKYRPRRHAGEDSVSVALFSLVSLLLYPAGIFSIPRIEGSGLPTVRARRVTKIAIDKRARASENKGHEESLAGVLPASGWLRGEEAAGCADSASNTEPDATTRCRTHRTLCSSQAGKCQHGNLQLSARDHCYRFENGAHQASLQENERRK